MTTKRMNKLCDLAAELIQNPKLKPKDAGNSETFEIKIPGTFTFEPIGHKFNSDVLAETVRKYEAEIVTLRAQVAAGDELLPEINDYVLATKFHDGDPGDAWAVGYYAGMEGSRHMVKDSAGKQMRLNGYWRVGKIRTDVGTWLLSDAAKPLENSPPGTVNLWTMLTDASKEVKP